MNMMLSIQQDLAEAQRCVEEMAELRKNQALAEKEYRVAKAKKVLELCKKRVDTFREQLEREWSESGWRS